MAMARERVKRRKLERAATSFIVIDVFGVTGRIRGCKENNQNFDLEKGGTACKRRRRLYGLWESGSMTWLTDGNLIASEWLRGYIEHQAMASAGSTSRVPSRHKREVN